MTDRDKLDELRQWLLDRAAWAVSKQVPMSGWTQCHVETLAMVLRRIESIDDVDGDTLEASDVGVEDA